VTYARGAGSATDEGGDELVGVVFDPSGTPLHFGMQRSFGVGTDQIPRGVIYEVEGPFRGPASAGDGPSGGSGPGGAGQREPAIAPAQDGATPSLRLRARKRIRTRRFIREGLPIALLADEPVGVDAWLRISVRDGDGDGERERRAATIGRAAPSVAVSGDVALLLEPTRSARRLLSGRREVTARLEVVATDGACNRTVERRTVELWRQAPGG
jgi:hypothetical protein